MHDLVSLQVGRERARGADDINTEVLKEAPVLGGERRLDHGIGDLFQWYGVVVQDEQVTDFDVGPIDVSGHIVVDAIASLIQANGATAAAVPPRILSGAAQKGKTVEDLMAQLEAGDPITDEEAQFLIQQMFIKAFQLDPIGTIMNGLPAEVPGFEGLGLQTGVADPEAVSAAAVIPEPGTLLLFMLAIALLLATRLMTRLDAGGFRLQAS